MKNYWSIGVKASLKENTWIMREEYQGKGFITEVAKMVMDLSFNQF